jgi:hypothetical protein
MCKLTATIWGLIIFSAMIISGIIGAGFILYHEVRIVDQRKIICTCPCKDISGRYD